METALTTLNGVDEKHLIQMSMENSLDGFNVLMSRHLKFVYNLSCHYVQSVDLAEELTQESFVQAFRSIKQYDHTLPFKTWLMLITINVCKAASKKQKSAPIQLPDKLDTTFLNSYKSQESLVTEDQTFTLLKETLQRLPEPMRQATVLRHIYDLPCEEIATTLGVNINTIQSWLSQSRNHLKSTLEHYGGLA